MAGYENSVRTQVAGDEGTASHPLIFPKAKKGPAAVRPMKSHTTYSKKCERLQEAAIVLLFISVQVYHALFNIYIGARLL